MQDLDFLQTPRIEALQKQMMDMENEQEKRRFLVMLAKEIISAIQEKTLATVDGSVEVSNLDSITASLRNELGKANKPIRDLLQKLNYSTEEQTSVIQQMEKKAVDDFNAQYQTVIIKRAKDQVEVTNLNEIVYPSEYKVTNLSDLSEYFKDLSDKISALKLSVNLPAPQVRVEPTPVNIPEVRIPEVNFDPLLDAIEKGLRPIRTNNKSHPLAVRLTDGAEWVKALREVSSNQAKTVQYMSDNNYIKNASGMTINPATEEALSPPRTIGDGSKTVTAAGTAEALATSTACKYVIITALESNTDTVWIGGSTVEAGRGRPLVSLQSEKIDIDNLSKVYVDSEVNGEGVSFTYVA